jgi:hypothetical protein
VKEERPRVDRIRDPRGVERIRDLSEDQAQALLEEKLASLLE